jgi:hypothetical protein
MGSQVSSEEKKKIALQKDTLSIEKKEKAKAESSGFYIKDTYDSYKGIKSQVDSNDVIMKELKTVSSPSECSQAEKEKNSDVQTPPTEVKIPTTFAWKEGGNTVYLTGSFDNWQARILMNKINNEFVVVLELPKGVYQYKFIVDTIWRFSKMHPNCNDGKGNINNIMDNSIFEMPQQNKDKTNENNEKFNKAVNSKINNLELVKSDSYSNIIPGKSELNSDAPVVPIHYLKPFNMNNNTRQNLIGNLEFMSFPENLHFNENNSYKKISIPPHINL